MSAKKESSAEALSDREIVTTRVFDAPRELVFKAWTDPDHLAKWWGPKGFTNTFQEFDMRPGGVWRFIMHGPDGVDYKNKSDALFTTAKSKTLAADKQALAQLLAVVELVARRLREGRPGQHRRHQPRMTHRVLPLYPSFPKAYAMATASGRPSARARRNAPLRVCRHLRRRAERGACLSTRPDFAGLRSGRPAARRRA